MQGRIFYAAGPGDVVETFRYWLEGVDDPSQYAVTYSSQFFDLIRRHNWEALVVSSNQREDRESRDGIEVINRPIRNGGAGGKAAYWREQLAAGFRLLIDLLKYRPDYAVIAEGTAPWLFAVPARLLGITIIPALHCVLWPLSKRPNRILKKLDQMAFRFAIQHCLCVSHQIIDQVRELAGNTVACHLFYPTYRAGQFENYAEADWSLAPIRLLYLGRIEKDKGIFDLLDAFSRVEKQSPGEFILEYCGDGSAFGLLKKKVADLGLKRKVALPGHCQREEVEKRIGASHIIMVPTTSDFVEGFNKTVAEGVLSRRHVIATSVCPAAGIFGDAVSVVPPNDPDALAAAILSVTGERRSKRAHFEAIDTGDSDRLLSGIMSWEAGLENAVG